MSPTHGDKTTGPTVVTQAGPMVLVRYRPGVIGNTARIVHAVALPTVVQTATVITALCDTVLRAGDLETVALGEGMPCIACVLQCVAEAAVTETPPQNGPQWTDPQGSALEGITYQQWGWPVTQHRNQVRLHLDHTASAVMLPTPLGARLIPVLIQRRCAPPVLAHPYLPDHRIVLTGEQFGLPLPWPAQVHQITGILPLPPTPTPRGPITWITTPHPDSLHLCREIDLFTALHSTQG